MKKDMNILLVFLLFFASCTSNSQLTSESNYFYRSALEYIKNDSTAIQFIASQSNIKLIFSPLKISVSPRVLPPNLAEFSYPIINRKMSLDLNDRHFSYNNSISDSLINYEKSLSFEPYIDNEINSIASNDNSNSIIFFSKVYDNFVTAMLFYRIENQLNTELPRFQPSLNYLIIFNDKKIEKVVTQVMYQ